MEGYEGVLEMLKYLMSDMIDLDIAGHAVMCHIPMIYLFIDYVILCATSYFFEFDC